MLTGILLTESLVVLLSAGLVYSDQWVAAFTLLGLYLVTLLMLLVRTPRLWPSLYHQIGLLTIHCAIEDNQGRWRTAGRLDPGL